MTNVLNEMRNFYAKNKVGAIVWVKEEGVMNVIEFKLEDVSA
jgi:hypothetical protein